MPSPNSKKFDAKEHLKQGKENEQLARALISLDSCYKDWVVTLAFYSALHYSYSKFKGTEIPHTHVEAEPRILKDCGKKVFKLYSALNDKSRNARYYPIIAKEYRQNPIMAKTSLEMLDKLKAELGIT
jgi:hypothetical protein